METQPQPDPAAMDYETRRQKWINRSKPLGLPNQGLREEVFGHLALLADPEQDMYHDLVLDTDVGASPAQPAQGHMILLTNRGLLIRVRFGLPGSNEREWLTRSTVTNLRDKVDQIELFPEGSEPWAFGALPKGSIHVHHRALGESSPLTFPHYKRGDGPSLLAQIHQAVGWV